MKQMVRVRPYVVGRSLDDVDVGRGSSARIVLSGVPRDMERVQIHVGRPGADGTTAVTARALTNWNWEAYLSPLLFPVAGEAAYHVTAMDERGASAWLGRGRLRIHPSVLNAEEVPLVPDDTYLRNPSTGLWHRLTVSFEDGVLVPSISDTGVER